MNTAKDLITLSIMIGFGLAILMRPTAATAVINSVSTAWFNLIRTVSGQAI